MKNIKNHLLPVAVLILALKLVLPCPVRAQGLITDQFAPDAATAALGYASSMRDQGSWGGFHNPAAWAGQPFLYSGVGTVDLWNHVDNGARLESGVAGMGMAGYFGFGMVRQRLRFDDPEADPFVMPAMTSDAVEFTDVYGAGVNIAKLLAPGNDFLNLSAGMNVKRQARSYFLAGPQPRLVTEDYTNYDLGGLASLRIPLVGSPEDPTLEPSSYLKLTGSYVLRNANRDRFQEETRGTDREVGLTSIQGMGFSLVLGRASRSRHLLQINGSYEYREFEQEVQEAGKVLPLQIQDTSQRYGLEIGLADVLFARTGRVRVENLDIDEQTYGAGLKLQIPVLGFGLSADYARTPWVHGGLGGVIQDQDPVMMDRFSIQAAFGI